MAIKRPQLKYGNIGGIQVAESGTGWPDHWPKFHNANINACDTIDGPCQCGSWHKPEHFKYRPEKTIIDRDGWIFTGILYYYGSPVSYLRRVARVAGW